MMKIPAPVRAWLVAVALAIAATAVLAAIVAVGVVAIFAFGAVPGLAVMLALAAVALGTLVWWVSGRDHTSEPGPPRKPLEAASAVHRTIPMSLAEFRARERRVGGDESGPAA